MKRILAAILLIGLMGVLVVPMASYAAATTSTPAPNLPVMDAIDNITNWAFTILMAVAALFIIFAAFEFITAKGEPEKVKSAREYVLYALVGVVVALLARGLVQLIETIVRG